ncbi:hypothetical protein BDV41DRAFT_556082 [Aspergillus transmontanensis]|uniref:Uncharacterized protein n=1 Tax=Aspergillus transmontanensis TaxID=1034304 RepID=A0A5N6VFZ4_9EURO|nr:hypothetical protein BDV41DRAFT_556082 [Aspergillus transmontanensis]
MVQNRVMSSDMVMGSSNRGIAGVSAVDLIGKGRRELGTLYTRNHLLFPWINPWLGYYFVCCMYSCMYVYICTTTRQALHAFYGEVGMHLRQVQDVLYSVHRAVQEPSVSGQCHREIPGIC